VFHVKHELGHDLAVEASDGFENALADAHDSRRAWPEEQSEPGVDLATGRPAPATLDETRARGAATNRVTLVRPVEGCRQLSRSIRKRGGRSRMTPQRVLATTGPN
jgi:hypothetical protein